MAEIDANEAGDGGSGAPTGQTESSSLGDSLSVQAEVRVDGDSLQGYLLKKSTKGCCQTSYFQY